ncbi:TetR family transcriptional regulator [Klenkia sp. LSe6-5]|uniref:TetR family transcriptional regulator n=1 Tax=Klenkia sesuvii TaxID=3103137 RepID=A0ABU8DUA1_9ACTN
MDAEQGDRRRYVSPSRAAGAQKTRRRIVAAAGALFAERGYQATTMPAIAAAAGVSVQSVHLAGPKSALLVAAFGVAFIGDEGQQALTDRPELEQIMSLPPAEALPAYASFLTAAHARSARIWQALRAAATTDPVVAGLVDALEARRYADFERAVAWAGERGVLVGPGDPAVRADVMAWLAAPETYVWFTRDRGWTGQQYAAWLVHALTTQAFGPLPD